MRNLFKVLVAALILSVSACGSEVTPELQAEVDGLNAAALKAPTFVGCLPDGRAMFMFNLRAPNGFNDSTWIDRVYVTLDGQSSAILRRPHGKFDDQQTISWPGASMLPAGMKDPCATGVRNDQAQ